MCPDNPQVFHKITPDHGRTRLFARLRGIKAALLYFSSCIPSGSELGVFSAWKGEESGVERLCCLTALALSVTRSCYKLWWSVLVLVRRQWEQILLMEGHRISALQWAGCPHCGLDLQMTGYLYHSDLYWQKTQCSELDRGPRYLVERDFSILMFSSCEFSGLNSLRTLRLTSWRAFVSCVLEEFLAKRPRGLLDRGSVLPVLFLRIAPH